VWDSTIAPEATVQHTIALGDLGGAPDEPLDLELTYVFLDTEPVRRAPDEPFTASVVRRRAALAEISRCATQP